jgi:hypothetical protein
MSGSFDVSGPPLRGRHPMHQHDLRKENENGTVHSVLQSYRPDILA